MSAQQLLIAKYGPPSADYIRAYCTVWDVKADFPWFPVSHFLVNNDFKKVLHDAFTALQAKGLHTEIKTFDGCYNDRSVRGSGATSLHAWAAACDFNAADNGMQSILASKLTPLIRLGKWSQQFIDTMKGAGLFYGGDFKTVHTDGTVRIDPMHFGLYNG
jgi:hypothetical protein